MALRIARSIAAIALLLTPTIVDAQTPAWSDYRPYDGAVEPAASAAGYFEAVDEVAPFECEPRLLPPTGFQRSLGRFGPTPPTSPATGSVHMPSWDPAATTGGPPPCPAPSHAPPEHDCYSWYTPFSPFDFTPDPRVDWNGYTACEEVGVYDGKHLNLTQRPWIECGWPLYGAGPLPPSATWLGPTNLVRQKFYLYGDFRTAVANNTNVGNAQTVWANRLNLDFDYSLTATERIHAFWGPLDEGQQFTGFDVNSGDLDSQMHPQLWDNNTDTLYFEGDLGAIVGGFNGTYAAFDLPFTVGLIPLVFQNGIWLEDAFVGAAATILAQNSPWADISNFDTTFFVGFDELTTRAFGGDDNANFVGVTTMIERRGGYIELGWAYVDDPQNLGRDYHNLAASYTRRYLNLVSNSARVIVNAGQGGPESQRTADGVLLLLENSLLTPLPYNVIPYCNLFAGFDRPQNLGQLQGPLRNTGINFETDLLTGYPTLDASGNDTYGAAVGVDLLGKQFDRQLIVEGAVLQTMDDPAGRLAPGDQYAAGVRWQKRLNHCLLLRADAMYGWLEESRDVSGARVELRHKF